MGMDVSHCLSLPFPFAAVPLQFLEHLLSLRRVDLPPDYDAHMDLGMAACAAIDAVHGRHYCGRTGPIFTVISPATGCCTDWMYASGGANITQSLATELRSGPRTDPAEILENGEEMMAGVFVMAEKLLLSHSA